MTLTFRAATLDDAALAADLMSRSYPAMEQDPVITRFRWENPRRGYLHGRFIVALDGRDAGFVGWVHGPWEKLPDRHCEIEVWLDRAFLDRKALLEMHRWICDQAIAEGAAVLLEFAGEDEPEMLEVMEAVGFQRDRLERVSELDLQANRERLLREAGETKAAAAAAGIELTTVAKWSDPEAVRKLYELDSRTRQDIPTTLPILTEQFEDYERRLHSPARSPERTWVALDHGRPVALTFLKFPPVRGKVWTGYTCTHPDHRGRGLARAVKLQSLAQAVELGVTSVRTDNDAENAAMLRINQALGYRPVPGFVGCLKRVERRERG
ncbi:MAG TPA: GNAT family N-acetyltransferase [Patescibacteria group bacterium]|nr:GNAT family N-acetyltransferase [Patescibacteria group bacterium]